MTKNLILGPILTHLAQMLAPIFFFGRGGGGGGVFTSNSNLTLFKGLIQCNLKENQWTKLEKMAKKLNFGSDFGLGFGPNLVPTIFFSGFYL